MNGEENAPAPAGDEAAKGHVLTSRKKRIAPLVEIQAESIPGELRELSQWVCWKYEKSATGKSTKVPYDPRTMRPASVVDPSTWVDFNTAVAASRAPQLDGIGFVLTDGDPYAIIDLDNKPDSPPSEEDWKTHQNLLSHCHTYIEKSPSGRGYHIVMRGRVAQGLKRGSVEVYSSRRYMAFTGSVVKPLPIKEHQDVLDYLVPLMTPVANGLVESSDEWETNEPVILDRDVIEIAESAENGAKYLALCKIGASGQPFPGLWDQNKVLADCQALGYQSQSEADMALLSILCFWSRSNSQVRRLFRACGLGKRDKASTDNRYLDRTLAAIRSKQSTNAEMQAAKDGMQTQLAPPPSVELAKLPSFAPELLELPYGLGAIQGWVHGQMIYPSMAAAGVTSLALLTHVAMPHVTIDSLGGLGLNEQYMIWAPTSSGKEGQRKPFSALDKRLRGTPITTGLNAHERLPALQYNAPASQQGMHQLLEANASQTFLPDEYGDWIVGAEKDPKRKEAMSYFMQAYTKALSTIAPPNAATIKYKPVENPRVLIFATSTADRMTEVMTSSQANSGMLNRYVIAPLEQERLNKRYEGQQYEPPQSVIDLAAWIISLPDTVMVFAPEAWQFYTQHDREVIEPLRFSDNVLAGRLSEQAIKMAALIALSDRRVMIERRDLVIAYAIRESLYERAAKLIGDSGAISGLHNTVQAVEQLTAVFAKHRSLRRSDLPNYSRAFKKLAIYERERVIQTLVNNGVFKEGARKGVLDRA